MVSERAVWTRFAVVLERSPPVVLFEHKDEARNFNDGS